MSPRRPFQRALVKLSGEALAGEAGFGLDAGVLKYVAAEIKQLHDLGKEISLVVGGGNFIRGEAFSSGGGIDRSVADHMGMLGTIMNALAMQSALEGDVVDLVLLDLNLPDMSGTSILEKIKGDENEPDANVWRGRFEVVSSPYMSNASLTGNSSSAWYLLADPNDIPVIEVAALFGRVEPTVDTAPAMFTAISRAPRGMATVTAGWDRMYFRMNCAQL